MIETNNESELVTMPATTLEATISLEPMGADQALSENTDPTVIDEQTLISQAAELYVFRKYRVLHPDGKFDGGGRWYPSRSERCGICSSIRSPSRAYPYSLMVHCRTLKHICDLNNLDEKVVKKQVQRIELRFHFNRYIKNIVEIFLTELNKDIANFRSQTEGNHHPNLLLCLQRFNRQISVISECFDDLRTYKKFPAYTAFFELGNAMKEMAELDEVGMWLCEFSKKFDELAQLLI